MVRRNESAAFVGGGFVFPGGAVDEIDDSEVAHRVVIGAPDAESQPWLAAALRETLEESGLLVGRDGVIRRPDQLADLKGADLYAALDARGLHLDGSRPALLSNWIGPAIAPRRFDTRFFVLEADEDTRPVPDQVEVTEAVWVRPEDALESHSRGEWSMILPTLRHLELLSSFESPDQAVEYARAQTEIPRIVAKPVKRDDGTWEVLHPGDPGYDSA